MHREEVAWRVAPVGLADRQTHGDEIVEHSQAAICQSKGCG